MKKLVQIISDGRVIISASGCDPIGQNRIIEIGSIELTNNLSCSSTNIILILSDDAIQMLGGALYGRIYYGNRVIKRGEIGDLLIEGNKVSFEVKSLFDQLNRQVTQNYSTTCRASLGDGLCKVDINQYALTNLKVIATDNKNISLEYMNAIQNHEIFIDGYLISDTGIKVGKIEALHKKNASFLNIALHDSNPEIKIGDVVNLHPTCNKLFRTCRNIFNNTQHFRGEFFGKEKTFVCND